MKRIILALLFSSIAWGQTVGPKFPVQATGNTNAIFGGTVGNWTNPGNITAADGAFATTSLTVFPSAEVSNDLIGTQFGFSIPTAAKIKGIKLEVNGKDDTSGSAADEVQLVSGGVAVGNVKQSGSTLPTTATTLTYGSSSDLWGTTLTATNINDNSFGAAAAYTIQLTGLNGNVSIDYFRITVTYSAGGSNMFLMFSQTCGPEGCHTKFEGFSVAVGALMAMGRGDFLAPSRLGPFAKFKH